MVRRALMNAASQLYRTSRVTDAMSFIAAVQAFSLSAQFARESAMLKLPEERRRWGVNILIARKATPTTSIKLAGL